MEDDADAPTEVGRELDAVEADLASARGRLMHGRILDRRNENLEQATEDPRELPLFEQAAQLCRDLCGEAEALRHLGIAEHRAGRLEVAQLPLEESPQLRQELGHQAGAASNMVGLIYIAVGQGAAKMR